MAKKTESDAPDERLAVTPADAYRDSGASLSQLAKRISEITEQAWKDAPPPFDYAAELENLHKESHLPWDKIAEETGITKQALLNISKHRTVAPTDETCKAIADFFSRELDRPVEFPTPPRR